MESIINSVNMKEKQISEKKLMHQFAENLKWLRHIHSIKQIEIARYLNIDRSSYCNYELERTVPKIVTMKMIADFYNIMVDDLINKNLSSNNY